VLLKSGQNAGGGIFGYFKGSPSLEGQALPEVKKALVDDAPRIVRLTIWAVILFFVFLLVWANYAVIDEVTKGEGKAIPSTKIQKIQNLEGGIVAQIYAMTRALRPTSARPKRIVWRCNCALSV
jgi:adhesin transport system membrane fusion protein